MKMLKIAALLCCLNFVACQQSGSNGGTEGLDNSSSESFKLTCSEAQFITYLNLYRAQNSRSVLQVSRAGVVAARWHAQNMIDLNYFAHSEPNGRSFSQRLETFKYNGWAENIAAGSSQAQGTFCQWKNSAGHNTNMLSASHRTTGIGHASGGGTYGHYWSSNFGDENGDNLVAPLTSESPCELPTTVPSC